MSQAWVDWLSYRPSDFLMFSPRTYWRLFELHNAAWWPWHLLALGLGAVGGVAMDRAGAVWWASAVTNRAVPWALALSWGFVAWYFHVERYAPINWAATGLAGLFASQGLVLAGLALMARPRRPAAAPLAAQAPHAASPQAPRERRPGSAPRRAAAALWLLALVIYPLLAPLQGRPWAQAELVGLAPDPTVVATLAWLLATSKGPSWVIWRRLLRAAAWALALIGAAASAATLATMGEWQALAPALAFVLAAAVCRRHRPGAQGVAPTT